MEVEGWEEPGLRTSMEVSFDEVDFCVGSDEEADGGVYYSKLYQLYAPSEEMDQDEHNIPSTPKPHEYPPS